MTLEQRSDSAAAGHEACDQPIRSLEILNQCVPLFETLKDPNRQQLLVQLVCHGPQTVGSWPNRRHCPHGRVPSHQTAGTSGFIEISKDATRRIVGACGSMAPLLVNVFRPESRPCGGGAVRA